jgi:hypothetical protein
MIFNQFNFALWYVAIVLCTPMCNISHDYNTKLVPQIELDLDWCLPHIQTPIVNMWTPSW